jgi:hypothetical protein
MTRLTGVSNGIIPSLLLSTSEVTRDITHKLKPTNIYTHKDLQTHKLRHTTLNTDKHTDSQTHKQTYKVTHSDTQTYT